ncbi:MAG: HlyD family secretion protein [Anaerolineae bacterium]
MGRRRTVIIVMLVVLLGFGYFGYSRYTSQESEVSLQAVAEEEEIVRVVSASGTVLPARWTRLSFKMGGRVEEVTVETGDEVQTGQTLARLSATDLEEAVARAEAALAVAEARLAQLKAGPRAEEIAVAQANLAVAKAGLAAAEAEMARLKAGAREEEIAAARATMDKAAVALQLAQAEYDKIAWQAGIGATAQAVALQQATADYETVRANYEALVKGATAEEIAIAQAQIEAAQAQIQGAKAQLDLLRAGATAEEITVVEAQVAQAEVVLAQARSALEDAWLLAPFAGTVTEVSVKEGEIAAAGVPVITLGDLSHLRVETTDLNEIDIARVAVGQKVALTFDALPERKLTGYVSRIAPMATTGQGGTNYTVTIELEELDPNLRWGMTAFTDIVVGR